MKREFLVLTPAIVAELYPDHRPTETIQGYALVENTEEGQKPLLMVAMVLHRSQRLLILRASREQRDRAWGLWMNRLVVDGAARVRKMIQASRLPVFARADPAIEGSERLIEYLGFEHLEADVWRYPA